MGGCATKENKENKPADETDGCVLLQNRQIISGNLYTIIVPIIIIILSCNLNKINSTHSLIEM